jgi:hypothetical protein
MKRFISLANLRLLVEVILVVAAFGFALSRSQPTEVASAAAPAAPSAVYWYQCNSPSTQHVGLFANRIHVWCQTTTPVGSAPALTGISWFAYPTSPDSAEASRFLSLFQTSAISGRYVWLELDPNDTSGSNFGCGSGDCRRIVGAELR